MTQTKIAVSGMSCGHCVAAVTEELEKIEGVAAVVVELGGERPSTVAITSAGPLSDSEVARAIDEAGYTLAQ